MAKKKKKKVDEDGKQYISKKLVTKKCDKAIYDKMEKYVKMILVEKNNYARILENDVYLKFKIIHGLGKFKFQNYCQTLDLINKNCPTTDLQSASQDVYTKFTNQVQQIECKFVKTYENERYYKLKKEGKLDKYPYTKPYKNICKENSLENLLNYLCDQFLYSSRELKTLIEISNDKNLFTNLLMFYMDDTTIKDYIFSRNTKTYLEWQRLINKFSYERLVEVAFKKFFHRIKSLSIIFKKLTIQHKNTINSLEKHFEKTNTYKYSNLLFNLNLPKIDLLQIPFKTNYLYHHKMDSLNITGTSPNKNPKYASIGGFKQTQFIFTIKLDEINKEIQIIYTVEKNDKNSKKSAVFNSEFIIDPEKTIGIDVNTKNNIFCFIKR